MRTNEKIHIVFWLFLLLLFPVGVWGKEESPRPLPASSEEPLVRLPTSRDNTSDSTSITAGEMPASPVVPVDSFQTEPPKSAGGLDAPVEYVAKDSIVLLGTGIAFLHGEADVKYQQLQLTSEFMRVQMDSSMVYAKGVLDTMEGEWIGRPVFKDHNDTYESDEITYNLKTQKAYIRQVVTE